MIDYRGAGVDRDEGYKTVASIKEHSKRTTTDGVISSLGGFASLYELKNYKEPVLVSGTDGVGTKLKIAFELGIYDTVGIDCVAMCVNDILCHGAKPLFFLEQSDKHLSMGSVLCGCVLFFLILLQELLRKNVHAQKHVCELYQNSVLRV